MFKRFDPSNDVSTSTKVKASIQRGIKSSIVESNPSCIEEEIDALIPKKSHIVQYKVGPHLLLYCRSPLHDEDSDIIDKKKKDDIRSVGNEPIFFQSRDGPILPTLRLVHEYPTLKFTNVTVDKGAIPFILGGANIMCPGLTNPGGSMPEDEGGEPSLNKGDGVVIFAEGKEFAVAVGIMKMSSTEVRSKNKGIAIEVAHFLGDGLFQTVELS